MLLKQMTVTATDEGLNPLSNSVTVTVDVDRNANSPVFQNIPTIREIDENQLAGQNFYTVTASDADTVVSQQFYKFSKVVCVNIEQLVFDVFCFGCVINIYQTCTIQSPFKDVTYSLVGDSTAVVYFQVDSSNGGVSLRQSVQADTASTYRVNFYMYLCD